MYSLPYIYLKVNPNIFVAMPLCHCPHKDPALIPCHYRPAGIKLFLPATIRETGPDEDYCFPVSPAILKSIWHILIQFFPFFVSI